MSMLSGLCVLTQCRCLVVLLEDDFSADKQFETSGLLIL